MSTIPDDSSLEKRVRALAARLLEQGRRLATAESCTGGWIAKCCTDQPGSSAWFVGGVIAYCNEIKVAMLECDLLIMADNAFLLSPFTTISLVPDGGLNWMLVRQLGYRRAFQLSIESERIAAERCVELGLANKTVAAEQLMDAAIEWADALSKRAPLSLAATKQAMRFAMDHDWSGSYDVEAKLQGELLGTEDNQEGINAFLEKRQPEFKGK